MATPTETARLAAAINLLRPDWPTTSIQTLLTRDHAHRPLHDLAVAAVWIATDPATNTPKRLNEAGPWWATSKTSTDKTPAIPPCPTHGYTARRPDSTYPCCDNTPDPTPHERQPTPPPIPLRQLAAQHRRDTPATTTTATTGATP